MEALEQIINENFNHIQELSADNAPPSLKDAVSETLNHLNESVLRVASPSATGWTTHEWLKKAILLSFKTTKNSIMPGFNQFFDKLGVSLYTSRRCFEVKAYKIEQIKNLIHQASSRGFNIDGIPSVFEASN